MPRCNFQMKLVGLLMFSFFSMLLLMPNAFAQQDKLIEALDIQGNRRLKDEEIVRHIKIRPGDRFDENQIQEDLQSLLKLGLFDAANTKVFTEEGLRGGIHVIFEVRELSIIVKINFDGLRYVTYDEILAELHEQKADVKIGDPYEPQKLKKALRVILEYLRNRGYVDAKVFITEKEKSATTVIVTFVIDELPYDESEDTREK